MSAGYAQLPLDEFVGLLPKTETHLHLEGALPVELLRTVQADVDLSSWESEFKFSGFEHFLGDLLDKQAAWFTSVERYHVAACWLFRRQLSENVRYVEVSVASGSLEQATLDGREVVAAIAAAAPPAWMCASSWGSIMTGTRPEWRQHWSSA